MALKSFVFSDRLVVESSHVVCFVLLCLLVSCISAILGFCHSFFLTSEKKC